MKQQDDEESKLFKILRADQDLHDRIGSFNIKYISKLLVTKGIGSEDRFRIDCITYRILPIDYEA